MGQRPGTSIHTSIRRTAARSAAPARARYDMSGVARRASQIPWRIDKGSHIEATSVLEVSVLGTPDQNSIISIRQRKKRSHINDNRTRSAHAPRVQHGPDAQALKRARGKSRSHSGRTRGRENVRAGPRPVLSEKFENDPSRMVQRLGYVLGQPSKVRLVAPHHL